MCIRDSMGTTTLPTAASSIVPQATNPHPRWMSASNNSGKSRDQPSDTDNKTPRATVTPKPMRAIFNPRIDGLVDGTPSSARAADETK